MFCNIDVFSERNNIVQRELAIFYGTLLPDSDTKLICNEYCNDHWSCLSMKRIIFIMKLYHNMKRKHNNNEKEGIEYPSDAETESESDDDDNDDIFKCIIEQLMLFEGYSLSQLLDDFHQIKTNHLEKNVKSWNCIKLKLGKCKFKDKDCFILKRHLRDRNKCDNDLTERRKLYGNNCDSDEVVTFQFLDQVHHYLMHWNWQKYEFPAKSFNDDNEEEEKKSVKDTKDKPLRGNDTKDRFINRVTLMRENRFVTNIDPTVNLQSFEFGESFYHWKFYKSRDNYIKPEKYKHENLKKEMLNNRLYPLGIYRWNDTLKKAIIRKYSEKGKKLVSIDCGDYNFNRGIPKNLPISIPHLMVILIYTNYDDPQREFKRKGMRMKRNECITDLTNDHCEISNFYKLFNESILFYGKNMDNSLDLYHGISSDKLFFSQFHPKFNAPISTTDTVTIAESFCGQNNDGMILKLKSDETIYDKYFYCGWCSDLSHEKEYLFAQAHHLFIKDIKLNNNLDNHSFSKYITSMSLLQDILNGTFFIYSTPDYMQYEPIIIQLLKSIDSKNDLDIPEYIIKSFGFFYQEYKTKKLQILRSDYMKLQNETREAIEEYFQFEKDNVKEFKWIIEYDKNRKSTSIIISNERAWDDNKDIFNFCMYIKPKLEMSDDKLSVGIWVKQYQNKTKK